MDQLKTFGFMIKEAVGLLKIPRTQSAPSVVGRVEEDHEKKKKYLNQEHSSSCGDFISMSREIPKDCLESSKGSRMSSLFSSRTGVYSVRKSESFEKRKQSRFMRLK